MLPNVRIRRLGLKHCLGWEKIWELKFRPTTTLMKDCLHWFLASHKTLQNIPIRWHFTLENLQTWNVAFANPNRDEIDLEEIPLQKKINL